MSVVITLARLPEAKSYYRRVIYLLLSPCRSNIYWKALMPVQSSPLSGMKSTTGWRWPFRWEFLFRRALQVVQAASLLLSNNHILHWSSCKAVKRKIRQESPLLSKQAELKHALTLRGGRVRVIIVPWADRSYLGLVLLACS